MLGFTAAIAAASIGGSAKTTSMAVTTTIANAQNGHSLRVGSDGQGGYVNTKQIESVVEHQTGGSDWLMSTYGAVYRGPTNRTVLFDLTEPVSTGNPPPPISVALAQAFLATKCSDVNIDLLAISSGSTVQCPGAFHFQGPNGSWYRLSFRPEIYPEVNDMNVSCTAADTSGCKTWSITPNGNYLTGTDPNPKGINKLLQYNPSTDAVIADLGDYYISFSIAVAR
jgi:hypothetical protein